MSSSVVLAFICNTFNILNNDYHTCAVCINYEFNSVL